ncbi:hypothetical protein [Spirochaeta isovalerica]|uniref:Uncharacterized protein n=1 Tax=Spirochaeta isovalerica TaxID=150 RepID=A0A841REL3_9SPIO|nr:hypothetical protein [Spirochaeta isovalerica]MBB6481440.1 hypothetical protein [Spirochaeta isovalerica]
MVVLLFLREIQLYHEIRGILVVGRFRIFSDQERKLDLTHA